MAGDLLSTLASLDEMLKDISKEGLLQPHNTPVAENDDDESPYSIKNGAYVRVDEDGMAAWIYLNPPKEGEKFYSRSEIVDFINEHNVFNGLHDSNISAIAKKHVYEREILIAKGIEPVEGNNGYYEYFFDTADKRKPAIREDGSVDYSSMSKLKSVDIGDRVAVYHPATKSQNGMDVYGHEIQAKPTKDLPKLRGRGISNDKNPNVYIATMAGEIDFMDNHIDIKAVHEVSGDVDLIIGKIEFFGDVHITGNVEAGVIIRASRNVTVDGVVSAAQIFAGGDVVIARGVQGGMKAHITAKGNVSADFIEHCTVEAGGNVRSNSYINAEVFAGGMVIAEGKAGLIVGGHARGLLGLTANNIGNESEVKTFVASGYSAEDYEQYVDIYKQENEAQKMLSEMVESLSELVKKKRLGNSANTEALDRDILLLSEKKDELFEALDQARIKKEKLEKIIEKGKGSVLVANEKIFRGVTVTVEGNVHAVPHNTSFMRYKNEGGRVVSSVIIVN